MLEQVRRTIARYRMLEPGDRVVVGVSAGPDSVALAHVLHRLAPEWGLRLHLFHLHHGLRGAAADEDARSVQELAARLGCPCTVARVDVAALARESAGGLEAVGRAVRYREMAAVAAAIGAQRMATGHHRNDQAETVLLRLVRGTGRLGLSGIPPVRPAGPAAPPGCTIVRPLIAVSRAEIETYCGAHGLQPREDATNADPRFLRNRVRLDLLPMLEQHYNRRIVDHLAELAEIFRAEEEFLEQAARAAWLRHGVERLPGAVRFPAGSLAGEPPAVARRMLRQAAAELDAGLELPHVDALLEQAAAASGTRTLDLPGGLTGLAEYGAVTLQRGAAALAPGAPVPHAGAVAPTAEAAEAAEAAAPVAAVPAAGAGGPPEVAVAVPGVTRSPALHVELEAQPVRPEAQPVRPEAQPVQPEAQPAPAPPPPPDPMTVILDPERLPGPLTLRSRRPGDRICPTGMTGSKKLQDLLVDLKLPRRRRDQVPVLAAGDAVVWVVGVRADRRFLAAPGRPGVLIRARWVDAPS